MTAPSTRPWHRRKRTWAAAIVLLLAPPATFMVWSMWVMTAPAIPYSEMDRLHVGMTDAEVRDLLGEPESIFPHDDGGKQWVFSRMTWAGYYVEFDPGGRIARHWHDY